MAYRHDRGHLRKQQQAIIASRDRTDEIRRNEENDQKKTAIPNSSKPLNSTPYCDLLEQVTLEMDGGGIAALEKIWVKELGREEIRFAYYKKDSDGEMKFVPRPLDLPLDDLEKLLEEGRKSVLLRD